MVNLKRQQTTLLHNVLPQDYNTILMQLSIAWVGLISDEGRYLPLCHQIQSGSVVYSLLLSGYYGLFTWEMITHLHVVLRSRMCEFYLLFLIRGMVLGKWTIIVGNNNAVSPSEIMRKEGNYRRPCYYYSYKTKFHYNEFQKTSDT
jgi:hypothetical protein